MRIVSSANAAIFATLNASADGMKSVEKFLEGESILTRLKDEDITASRARNLLYKFLIRVFSGPLGKGVRMQLPDCCLNGVRSLLKNKDPNEVFTGFKPTSKRSKCSKSIND